MRLDTGLFQQQTQKQILSPQMIQSMEILVLNQQQLEERINEAVAAEELAEKTQELARKIAAKSAHAIQLGKQVFYRQLTMDLADAYAYASERMACNMDSEDASEGIDAFIQKRKPEGKDR